MAVDGIALDGKTLIEVAACKTSSTSPSSFLSIIYPLSLYRNFSLSHTISPHITSISPSFSIQPCYEFNVMHICKNLAR